MRHSLGLGLALCAVALLGACTAEPEVTRGPAKAEYLGIRTVLLDGEMVSFRVAMKGARDHRDVEAYGRCAAAQYALIRGAGFVRHLRTTLDQSGGIYKGDAVYLVSSALPRGAHTIDAEVTVRDCGELRIPTV